ncbi:flagellar biosynthetic protein FliP [bacterium (Candidatus Blackallbacteria) CG17_big_fil_post_rev_8_21_14_2_50_48_46]|uniref:Flagellar biosynthetic protein FliP n=1 Tax=bacterium (Candidatus Blackallbacteria) CG17_big_fil_post_rev_8_21_14_2_50_48_46 TaxID=2014261 RepID=A0A2M7G9Z2_9BACT|nr:MAG: flagellar biosynthetic protein FliP [bacterium (Candidatus Blackallbacteria) CG18_big_fil_WC_8_21_14_2_50_49_26]PIW18958.1 MAG: flagellar biosynthetic protein FliP [bacterium (Candidatus Blackallbacteria) CG17_big_fil_post_rev_8_21_14_2_50_48_46]PIW44674.1 MAG: flagellar biosynthetic protein FliP [bacterium (Candidatus Blackallbacteria) CG13_big_fil_rev_8_21_14_2_50_49_14]
MFQIQRRLYSFFAQAGILFLSLFLAWPVQAQNFAIPRINIGVEQARTPEEMVFSVQLLLLFTVLALAPTILVMMTPFTRIVIVLGFLRQALGTQQAPPNQVLVGLALFMTLFISMPTFQEANDKALQPFLKKQINQEQALEAGLEPFRKFMLKQVRQADLELYLSLAKVDRPKTPSEVPTHVLIPAFITSELKTAFLIGFLVYIPFLIIDMVIASTLMSMGMMMLPPTVVSLPFKLIMFVLIDGWNILSQAIIGSFS